MHLDIDVTQADIDDGVKMACESCPVALAVSRAGLHGAIVSQEINGTIDGTARNFGIPPELVNFILDFDAGLDVAPLSCTLYEC